MLIPRTRTAIFRACPFADYLIAEMQQSYARDFDPTDSKDKATLNRFYDHLQPLQPADWSEAGSCVLTREAAGIREYEAEIGIGLQQFYAAQGIRNLYLLNFLNTSLAQFPSETFRKRNAFRRLTRGGLDHKGFLLPTSDLPAVLPLLFFSGVYDHPVLFFFAADGAIPLSLHLCDDGNFHTHYPDRYRAQVSEAAEKAGLTLGADASLCEAHSIYTLRHNYYRSR
jgi:hypothetical protein